MKTSAMAQPGVYIVTPLREASRNRMRSRIKAGGLGSLLVYALVLQALLVLVSISFGAEGSSSFSPGADLLTCSYQPSATQVPVVAVQDGKASVRTLGMRWNPSADPAHADVVSITMQGDAGASSSMVESQAWIAALSAAFAWQNPWQGAAWTIDARGTAASDGTGLTAPLAVAMIASAAGVAYPADTAVIAALNPDGTLAPVPQIEERLAAASQAGLKRVVIPAVQRFEGGAGADGKMNDLVARSRELGLECLPADSLSEAAEKVLGRSLPALAGTDSVPRIEPALFQRLESESQAQLTSLQSTRAQWPLTAEQQAALPVWQRALWSEAAVRFENGAAFLRGGKVYAARGELGEANALVYALNSLRGSVPPLAELQAEAATLKTSYRAALARAGGGEEELQSGLAAAEMADWVDGVTAEIEGAENLVSQAASVRSQALPEQKQMALVQLAVAVKKAEIKQDRLASFAALGKEMAARGTVPVYDRAGLWLPQLVPAHLALGESFVMGLRKADPALARNLIYDSRLTAQTRLLRDRKAVWDNRENVRQAAAVIGTEEGAVQPVGFTPGDAYRPAFAPVAAVSPGGRESDTEQTLRWVNDYTEMALLYDRYFQFGGSYSPKEMSWSFEDRAVLDSQLQSADLAARRGIRAAQLTGVDTGVLEMVYERASALRSSRLDGSRMEALRQYWRCSLLGNMAWQLAAIPKAQALPPQLKAPSPQLAMAEDLIVRPPAAPEADPDAQPAPRSEPDPSAPPSNVIPNNPNLDPHPIPVALTVDADEDGTVRRAMAVSY